MSLYFEFVTGIVVILIAIYYYYASSFKFWKKRGVKGPEPVAFFGNAKKIWLKQEALGTFVTDVYKNYESEALVGVYMSTKPMLVVRDPDLIKDVLIRDFSKFADRGVPRPSKAEPLGQNLFGLEPERWRPLRTRLSPVFTSGKLKEMFDLIAECGDQLEKYLNQLVDKNEPVEFRELTARYTTDVIGCCAFGLDIKSLTDEDNEFRKMGKKIFTVDLNRFLRMRARELVPKLYNFLGYFLPEQKIVSFFRKSLKETIAYRKKNKLVRHDFVDVLIDLQDHPEKLGREINVDDTFIVAQAFVFFAAGFETSSTTISHAIYELAQNHDIQDKLRAEIRDVHIRNLGNFPYESVKRMKYLDMVFKETLRKYPPGRALLRKSLEEYTFEGTKVTIPKNTGIFIPVYGLQHDPNIYPNPDVFDPMRFTDEEVERRHPMCYLPFGDGPRNCIGARFAIYQSKMGIIKIIQNFKIDVCEKTIIPYVVDVNSIVLAPKGGIYLKLSKAYPNSYHQ